MHAVGATRLRARITRVGDDTIDVTLADGCGDLVGTEAARVTGEEGRNARDLREGVEKLFRFERRDEGVRVVQVVAHHRTIARIMVFSSLAMRRRQNAGCRQ